MKPVLIYLYVAAALGTAIGLGNASPQTSAKQLAAVSILWPVYHVAVYTYKTAKD
jgi:hypothetical protein